MSPEEPDRQQHEPDPPPELPKTWRESFLHSLPYYSGPHRVGYLELELPVREARTFSNIKRNHEHALRLDTVLFSVYYPCAYDPDFSPKAKARVPWLPRPRIPTCKGYAKFFSVPHLPVTVYIAATSMFTKLPAFRNATLASGWSTDTRDPSSSRAEEAADGGNPPAFPVVFFSHGLGGSRTSCSSICGELASYGYVVVAMEHRDGSGARTYVNVPPTRDSPYLSRRRSLADMDGATTEEKERKRHYMVDYVFPKDNPLDTSPNNDQGIDFELRGAQIAMRLAEIEEAFYALQRINEGNGEDVTKANLRKKGNRGSSSRGLEGIDWTDWRGRLHLENVTMMGHSFGGATTVQILRLNERFKWVGQGVLLDPWGPGAPEIPKGSDDRIRKPLLSIGSEAFMHWKNNYERVREFCLEARKEGTLCWMMTIRGSTHLSQTDFALLYPKWMSLFFKTVVNPRRAVYITVDAILEFFKIILPPELTRFEEKWVNEDLLMNTEPQTDVSLEHKPDDKWIAARLKIDNELRLRYHYWLRRLEKKRDDVPRDASGRPLLGLKNWGHGNEVWMHMSPDEEELERHLDQSEGGASETEPTPTHRIRCPTM